MSTPPQRVVVDGLGRLPVFSHASVADGWVFVSGTLGTTDAGFELAPGGAGPETTQTLRNIERILREAGAGLRDVVKVSVYVADMADFPTLNAMYADAMGTNRPARSTVQAAALPKDALVEIDVIARIP